MIARVRSVDGEVASVEFRTGDVAPVWGEGAETLAPGDLVLVRNSGEVIPAPEGTKWEAGWKSPGIVRIRNKTFTLMEMNGGLQTFPTSASFKYKAGYTVEVDSEIGPTRVLSKKPIRLRDIDTSGSVSVSQFRLRRADLVETFEDFGGHETIVRRARDLIETPLNRHEELAEIGARPIKGVLFTGPPGTGKTMLARIIAKESGAKFYLVSGPEITSKWMGDSESLLRSLFAAAAAEKKAILFFDEIDSIASKREGDSHEASKRLVAQLLTLMDGFGRNDNVVVVATTNRIQDIDPALRRPGRFDWEISFPMPDSADRLRILRVSERRVKSASGLPHEEIAQVTDGWSPAELTEIWSEAALVAAASGRRQIEKEDYMRGYERIRERRAENRGDDNEMA